MKYLTSTPDIMGGQPVITGTRVPISVILYRLKEGYMLENIHEMYPHIDMHILEGAIDEAIETVTHTLHVKKTLPQTQTSS
jgi:uncharacterized protein (DUF433 family)